MLRVSFSSNVIETNLADIQLNWYPLLWIPYGSTESHARISVTLNNDVATRICCLALETV